MGKTKDELKIYKDCNAEHWDRLEIDQYYENVINGAMFYLQEKLEPEVVIADLLLANDGAMTYSFTADVTFKDYDFGAYRKITEQEYLDRIQYVQENYTPEGGMYLTI